MRVAVLSDIHGNLLALEAVLTDLAAQGGADALVIAGDLCLDGPRPREVLARVRALNCAVVQGNTDRDLAAPPEQDAALDDDLLSWTRAQIGEEGVRYLAGLPFAHRIPAPSGKGILLVVHANPKNLDQHLPPFAPESQIAPLLADLPPDVTTLAFGHLHLPYVRDFGRLRLIDIASVGLPKDGDRRAGYGLLTWVGEQWAVEQRRVEYPVEETVAQLRAAAPPGVDDLIRKLLRARYPNMVQARGGREVKRPSAGPRVTAFASVAAPPPIAAALAAQEPPAPPARALPDTMKAADSRASSAEPTKSARRTRKVLAASQSSQRVTPSTAAAPETSTAGTPTPPDALGGLKPHAATPVGAGSTGQPGENAPATSTDPSVSRAIAARPKSEAAAAIPAELSVTIGPRSSRNDEVIDVSKKKRAEAAVTAEDTAVPLTTDEGTAKDKQGRKAAKRARLAREAAFLRADESFPLVLPLLLEGRLSVLRDQAAAVRDDDDPEAIHVLRVAIRHLRTALEVAEPFFGAKAYKRVSKQTRTLAAGLGKVRDADVLLAYLRTKDTESPDNERMGIETLIDALSIERAGARDELDPLLDRWVEVDGGKSGAGAVREALTTIKPRRKAGTELLTGWVVAESLETAIGRFEKRGADFAEEDADPDVAHELRIAAKKLRYTLELFASLLPAAVEEQVVQLKDLQDLLGALHDRDVLADLLAWERAQALERQLHQLEQAVFIPGSREDRLQAVRGQLDAPDSFTATAPGIYGLLIDVLAERDELEIRLRERWAAPQRGELVQRLRATVAALLPTGETVPATAEPITEATHG